MAQEKQNICPTCNGNKIILGTCECNQEWRGNQVNDDWEDCQCTPELECPTCHGSGHAD